MKSYNKNILDNSNRINSVSSLQIINLLSRSHFHSNSRASYSSYYDVVPLNSSNHLTTDICGFRAKSSHVFSVCVEELLVPFPRGLSFPRFPCRTALLPQYNRLPDPLPAVRIGRPSPLPHASSLHRPLPDPIRSHVDWTGILHVASITSRLHESTAPPLLPFRPPI